MLSASLDLNLFRLLAWSGEHQQLLRQQRPQLEAGDSPHRIERSPWGHRPRFGIFPLGPLGPLGFNSPNVAGGTPTIFSAFCLVGRARRAFLGEEGVQGEGQKSPRLNVFPTSDSREQSREFPTLGNIASPVFPGSRQPCFKIGT